MSVCVCGVSQSGSLGLADLIRSRYEGADEVDGKDQVCDKIDYLSDDEQNVTTQSALLGDLFEEICSVHFFL